MLSQAIGRHVGPVYICSGTRKSFNDTQHASTAHYAGGPDPIASLFLVLTVDGSPSFIRLLAVYDVDVTLKSLVITDAGGSRFTPSDNG